MSGKSNYEKSLSIIISLLFLLARETEIKRVRYSAVAMKLSLRYSSIFIFLCPQPTPHRRYRRLTFFSVRKFNLIFHRKCIHLKTMFRFFSLWFTSPTKQIYGRWNSFVNRIPANFSKPVKSAKRKRIAENDRTKKYINRYTTYYRFTRII